LVEIQAVKTHQRKDRSHRERDHNDLEEGSDIIGRRKDKTA
jgi:hypothetical protein